MNQEISETIFSIERINRMPLENLQSLIDDCYNEIPINFYTIILLTEKLADKKSTRFQTFRV